MVNQQLEPLYAQKMGWEQELKRLEAPLCPGEIGDLPLYAKRLEAIRIKHKQLKQMERGLRHAQDKEALDAMAAMHSDVNSLLVEAYAMPCHGCPVQKPCSKQSERTEQLQKRIKEFDRRIGRETTKYWRTFEALANILRTKGYLDGDSPTALGRMAAAIRGTNELFLTEAAISGILEHLSASEFAAVVTALVSEEGRGGQDAMRIRVSANVDLALERLHGLARKLLRTQRDFDVEISVEFSPIFSGLTQMWADGVPWEQMRMASQFDEGDIVRAMRRTVDLCRQFVRAPGMKDSVVELSRAAETLLARDEVKEDFGQ
jgi:superfamily II RNA helicase